MRHVIDAIAAQGRNGDTELLHVTKGELAGLDNLARRHYGRSLPRNPRTGLKEASLFRDWFGQDVGMALDVAAPVAVGFIPGVGVPAAVAMGAATGAANQGLGKGGTTETALLGGVMGGMGAYGGAGLAEGLAGGAAAGAGQTGVTAGVTPIGEAGASLGAAGTEAGVSTAAPTISEAGSNLAQLSGQGQMQGQAAMNAMPNLSQGATAAGSNMPGATAAPVSTTPTPTNWDYLATKPALSNATPIATSAMGVASLPSGAQTTDTGITSVNKTLPKAEVYYTPYGERRTRIAAAQGGLMGYGDYDGAEDGVGIRQYGFGGVVESIQPGGAWGNATADLYGVVDKNLPFMKDITPGGAVGQLQPGRRDWERKQAEEEQRKKAEQEAGIAAALKSRQDQESSGYWKQRYGMADGGPVTNDSTVYINTTPPPQVVTPSSPEAYARAFDDLGGLVGLSVIRKRAGNSDGMAGGGIANIAAAKGRYLQGPGDGMSDSIPASIDGKQEARLATGEFVVPADVVSHLGNGDSNAGAKQLHAMMDRARQTRTGTKKQGKQINPRKVMPT